MNNYCVYIHTNKTDGKRYVGITCQNVSRRWRSGEGYMYNAHFYRAIQKYGWDNFTHEIVEAGLSKDDACELEIGLITKYKTTDERYGYNRSTGGESPASGVLVGKTTRQKMSDAHRGVAMSEEAKQKLREKAVARGNGKQGKVGKNCGKSGIVRQIDIVTGEIVAEYFGFDEASRRTGFSKSPLKRAANGQQKQSYGFKWEYISRRAVNVVI